MTELVLFDCDGVLVDSETIICRIEADELTRIGFAITPQELATRFLGVSAATTYAEVERELGRPLPESFGACVEARVFKAFKRELRHISGVPEALVAIAQPVCVTSSASLDRIRLCLSLTGLHLYFAENLFSTDMVARSKPAPDVFLYAAELMGFAPSACLVIEDSVAGVEGARAAGMRAFGFTGGAHCTPGMESRLRDAGASLIFADMHRLPGLISACAS